MEGVLNLRERITIILSESVESKIIYDDAMIPIFILKKEKRRCS